MLHILFFAEETVLYVPPDPASYTILCGHNKLVGELGFEPIVYNENSEHWVMAGSG